jgi:hypothetical protein
VQWNGGAVSAVWSRPATPAATTLILAHGAGGNLFTPGLAQFAGAVAARGVAALRFNFPYAEARRKVPDRQATLEACYRAVAETVASQVGPGGPLVLGGRSMGGRIASHVVAAGFPAAGLLFLSYPLHPPAQPDRLRDAHLRKVAVPMLFLQGSRDAFARPDLLAATVAALPTATLHTVDGGDHGLRVQDRAAEDVTAEIVEVAVRWMRQLLEGHLP